MTAKQIEILRTLGYEDTQESGAILEHPEITNFDCFVWEDAKFNDVVSGFCQAHEKSVKAKMISAICKS